VLQASETLPWSTFDVDINGSNRPNSRSASDASHLRDGDDRLKLLERSLQNAVYMVNIFCICATLSADRHVMYHNIVTGSRVQLV